MTGGERPADPSPAGSGSDPSNVVRPEGEQGVEAPGMGLMGMWVFLASLSMLFIAGIVGVVWVRIQATAWPPPGMPDLPPALVLSTLLALGCSVTMQLGLNAIRRGDNVRLNRMLMTTNALAAGFLIVQLFCWIRFYGQADFSAPRPLDPMEARLQGARPELYGFMFYMLTVVHALHVVGGMIALAVTTHNARRGLYNWAFYPGVRHATLYWHFLDVVWLVLYAVLIALTF